MGTSVVFLTFLLNEETVIICSLVCQQTCILCTSVHWFAVSWTWTLFLQTWFLPLVYDLLLSNSYTLLTIPEERLNTKKFFWGLPFSTLNVIATTFKCQSVTKSPDVLVVQNVWHLGQPTSIDKGHKATWKLEMTFESFLQMSKVNHFLLITKNPNI